MNQKKVVIITGSSGFIGSALVRHFNKKYKIIGIDQTSPKVKEPDVDYHNMDIISEADIAKTMKNIRDQHGDTIHSVIHLIAYYSFSGEEDERYKTISINGTRNLINQIRKNFNLQQFIFSSSMLVYKPVNFGQKIDENSTLGPSWPYPKSKVEVEKVLREEHNNIPVVNLRIAGVYDDFCRSPTISNQIVRIFEGWFTSALFPGDCKHGQSFLHLDDFVDAVSLLVEKQNALGQFETFVLGEEIALSYQELQREVGQLLHNYSWPVIKVPKWLAKFGAVMLQRLPLMREPFIKPWMIEHSDDHFDLDITKFKRTLQWAPKKNLKDTLPAMIQNLKKDPATWYKINKIEKPIYRDVERIQQAEEKNMINASVLVMFLGLWLIGSPMNFGIVELGEYYSQIISGTLLLILGTLAIFPTLRWLRWVNALIGVWLLFSPLVFNTISAASYLNDSLIGTLVLLASTYTPSKSRDAAIPPGWSYNPSTSGQRLPIMFLAFLGYLFARYLASFQLKHISDIWEPFFESGTVEVLTSHISKAFPISDAGLGALTYLLDVIAAAIGGQDRWKRLPWAVILFGIMIVPSGVTSIVLVMLQPIAVDAWCTICLITAFVMLLMVPPALDEILASVQFLIRRKRAGESFWKVFLNGSETKEEETIPPIKHEGKRLYLYFAPLLGIWLMFAPWFLEMESTARSSTYIVAALVVTFSIIALGEVARIVRFFNIPMGLWLGASGWILDGMDQRAAWASLIVGIAVIFASLPRGKIDETYGKADRMIHWTPLKR